MLGTGSAESDEEVGGGNGGGWGGIRRRVSEWQFVLGLVLSF